MSQTTQQQRNEWLSKFQALAVEWGGECLSDEYRGQRTKLEFRCAHGHCWAALPSNVYHKGSWCPHCNGNAKLSISDAHQAAKKLGGRCLSAEYISVHNPLDWECASGHRFSASLTSVRTIGAFCMDCQKLTIEEFQRLCRSINYTLLTTEYVNNYTTLSVLCDIGHRFEIQPKHLKEGRRCFECRSGKHQNAYRPVRNFSFR